MTAKSWFKLFKRLVMNRRIGFIGAGNMGKAIIGGLMASKAVQPEQVFVFNPSVEKIKPLQTQFGVNIAGSAKEIVEFADIIFLAVKPNVVSSVLSDILGSLREDSVIVSVAAGVTLDAMQVIIGNHRKIVRAMPNTPALVNEAMTSITPNANVSEEELADVTTIFNSFGKSAVVPEYLIHAVVGASGSAPAYVFMFIEAIADAAVLAGMPRDQAYKFAAQGVLGSAKMVLETGKHPGELKDMVCSPGGTTIEAVKTLENYGFRSAVINAIGSCIDKSKKMSGE
jgi:pyrroline-5-carboxylate reductase